MATQPVTARTKFVVPFIPHSTIVRRALLARLDAEVEPPLTVLAAAPGSGKTSLLAQWVRTIDRPVAWLSCTMDDADPSVFWRDVEVAIRQAWSSLTWDAPDAVDQYTPRERTIEAVNNLALSGAAGAIVVDDFHLASPGPTAMTEFVDVLPCGVRLVLGTRADRRSRWVGCVSRAASWSSVRLISSSRSTRSPWSSPTSGSSSPRSTSSSSRP